jgi:hypothetical protein
MVFIFDFRGSDPIALDEVSQQEAVAAVTLNMLSTMAHERHVLALGQFLDEPESDSGGLNQTAFTAALQESA